jgi:hypothetical protein
MGKSTLLKLLAWRKILVPKNIDVRLVEQGMIKQRLKPSFHPMQNLLKFDKKLQMYRMQLLAKRVWKKMILIKLAELYYEHVSA